MIRREVKVRLRLCASLTFKSFACKECEGVFMRFNDTKEPTTNIDKPRKIPLTFLRRDIVDRFFITSFSARESLRAE